MVDKQFTRRSVIKTVGAALPAVLISSTYSSIGVKSIAGPVIGVSTLGFGNLTNAQLAEELAKQDFHVVQLFLNQSDSRYWRYNGRTNLSSLNAARCSNIADIYRSAGISLHSLGVYTNLIHPDEAERRANLHYFEGMMKVGKDMGIRMFVSEAGHYHPEGPVPSVAYHFQQQAWEQMVTTGKRLAELAGQHNATILLEPYFQGFLASSKRTRVFLEAVDSTRIRALLDPANLLEVDDLGQMFEQLTPWIDCLHAKDRKLHHEQGVPAGKGDLDYAKFAMLAARYTPEVPFILEYVGPDDYLHARQYLRQAISKITN